MKKLITLLVLCLMMPMMLLAQQVSKSDALQLVRQLYTSSEVGSFRFSTAVNSIRANSVIHAGMQEIISPNNSSAGNLLGSGQMLFIPSDRNTPLRLSVIMTTTKTMHKRDYVRRNKGRSILYRT